MMKKMVKLNFGKWKVVKFSGSYYVNFFVEKDLFVVIDGEKYFKIKNLSKYKYSSLFYQ